MTASRSLDSSPVSAAILYALREAGRRVLLVPEEWDLVDAITGARSRSRVALHRLAEAGWLVPVRRGAWAVRSPAGTIRLSALGLVGAMTRGLHLVTAGQALAFHHLSDQSFREIVVVVPHAQRNWSWLGTRVRYVRMDESAIWGGREHDFSGLKTAIASPERAILDSLAHPRWGVTLSQVTEALDRASRNDPRFLERLALAAAHYDNAMLARRLGFLVERLHSPEEASAFLALRGKTNTSARLLTADKASAAENDARWRVAANVPFEALAGHREIG